MVTSKRLASCANQVRAHKSQQSIIDEGAIGDILETYTYPLHFFDYETFGPAIPAFNSFSPYQRMPFQFSLHELREPGGELEHVEYLHEEASDPTEKVGALLDKHIDPSGTVLVWHQTFERGVNTEIGERMPAYAREMERINGQVLDLEKIFTEQHYVHPGFKGKTSIKYVLPVLCPELSYKELAIQEGATASNEWWRMIGPLTSDGEKRAIASALREYCKLDTYAMYAIWKTLGEVGGL